MPANYQDLFDKQTLYIDNIPASTTKEDLIQVFESMDHQGKCRVKTIWLATTFADENKHKGYGFVRFNAGLGVKKVSSIDDYRVQLFSMFSLGADFKECDADENDVLVRGNGLVTYEKSERHIASMYRELLNTTRSIKGDEWNQDINIDKLCSIFMSLRFMKPVDLRARLKEYEELLKCSNEALKTDLAAMSLNGNATTSTKSQIFVKVLNAHPKASSQLLKKLLITTHRSLQPAYIYLSSGLFTSISDSKSTITSGFIRFNTIQNAKIAVEYFNKSGFVHSSVDAFSPLEIEDSVSSGRQKRRFTLELIAKGSEEYDVCLDLCARPNTRVDKEKEKETKSSGVGIEVAKESQGDSKKEHVRFDESDVEDGSQDDDMSDSKKRPRDEDQEEPKNVISRTKRQAVTK